MRFCTLLVALASGAAIVACSTEPTSSPPQLSTSFVRPGTDPIPTLRATGGVGVIVVEGAINTPEPCYDFSASVKSRAGGVSLEIVAARQPVLCPAVLATFAYEAVLRDVAPGALTVLVTHILDGRRSQVLESVVTVR